MTQLQKKKTEKQNTLFFKALSIVLVSVLILITLIFLMIYTYIKNHSLEQAYQQEQENIVSISSSFSVLEENATTVLHQLYNNANTYSLVYDSTPNNATVAKQIDLFYDYIEAASSWIDSAYLYNVNDDDIISTYIRHSTYSNYFSSLEKFWDKDFIKKLSDPTQKYTMPILRDVHVPSASKPNSVLSYYMPVQSHRNFYDGMFVVNISTDRLMEFCHGIAYNENRQIIIADSSKNYYSNNALPLSKERLNNLLDQILVSKDPAGELTVQGKDAEYYCTWNQPENSSFVYISCIPLETILSPLDPLSQYLILFYCAVLLIFFAAITIFFNKTRAEYDSLQKQYHRAVKQYQNNHSYVKDSLLRNFLNTKDHFEMITERFEENKIYLKDYQGYNLALLEITTQPSITPASQPLKQDARIILQNLLSEEISRRCKFEVVDTFLNRQLIITESTDYEWFYELIQNISAQLLENYEYSLSGIYAANIEELNELPYHYQQLTSYFEMLYFYPSDTFIDITTLKTRKMTGHLEAAPTSAAIIQSMKNQQYEKAAECLSSFFDIWYEPLGSVPQTLNIFVNELSSYTDSLVHTHAISIDFDYTTFLNLLIRCNNAQSVKTCLLSLLDDIRSVFASANQRGHHVNAIIQMIHSNYCDPNLNVENIADSVGLSSSHMQSVFKSSTGISISKYIRHYRLEKAAKLLIDTNISINKISEQTGFCNESYFYTIFKKHYSLTPSEYRNLHQKQ